MADKQCGSNNVKGIENRFPLAAEFPSPRYFQVHFEYLDSLLLDAAKALEVLRTEVAEVYRVMQTEPVLNQSGIDQVNSGATPALRLEPCGNRKRSKRSSPRQNVGCAAGR